MAAPANEFLPQDVIDDIFARLPFKSVIRFKSVSKPFHASLSDPHFTRWHYHRSKSYKDDTKFLLLSKVKNRAFVIASCPRHDPKNPALSMTISNFDFPKKKSPEKVIIGSGDGLRSRVWNPSTRERRLLPELGRPSFGGICYDPRIDDYKFVVFFDHKYAVFELKDKCWKMGGSYTDGSYTGRYRRAQPTEPINGAIYWMIRGGRLGYFAEYVIYSFDLLKDELTQITPPPDCYCRFELGVWHDCLCMVKENVMGFEADKRWVMKEYGVWTELNSIEQGSMFVYKGHNVLKFVGGSWRGYSLHICNLGYGKPICVEGLDNKSSCGVLALCRITKVIRYSESLISPWVTR